MINRGVNMDDERNRYQTKRGVKKNGKIKENEKRKRRERRERERKREEREREKERKSEI